MNQQIRALYVHFYGQCPVAEEPIGGSASNRTYIRFSAADGTSVIGVGCPDPLEKRAFCELADVLSSQGVRVPRVFVEQGNCYLQEDLGRTSLYDLIGRCQKSGTWDDETVGLLHQVMRDLPEIQSKGLRGFDLTHCCREQHFSAMNVRWDLNYFKYCFLKGTGVTIDELRLQVEFDRLEKRLLGIGALANDLFLYRDFQSRNVMIHNGMPYYIDFQGGYEGPFYYDVASFLWQARAAYPKELRESLLATYFEALRTHVEISVDDFRRNLEQFVLFRLLQVLGAYGLRGIVERKAAFLSPIAGALAMIREVGQEYAYLHELLRAVDETPLGRSLNIGQQTENKRLTVKITSFSYKKGIPDDFSGNGGGFVFDCRAPHNPGRYAEYKYLTGLDQPVIDFLEGRDANPEHRPIGCELTMPQYMEHVYALVDPAVETYCRRGFTSLMVSFGCTGGQHRSVYGAQHLADHLREKFPDVNVELRHRKQNISN